MKRVLATLIWLLAALAFLSLPFLVGMAHGGDADATLLSNYCQTVTPNSSEGAGNAVLQPDRSGRAGRDSPRTSTAS